MTRDERISLAQRRITSILRRHGIATTRTLEQKISDAGPNNQRIDPHILTEARNKMSGLKRQNESNSRWYFLTETPMDVVQQRLKAQLPIYQEIRKGSVTKRIGQAFEIAVYRALLNQDYFEFLGRFSDLDEHDDSQSYFKVEPPSHISSRFLSGEQKLDFLIQHPSSGWAGIEVKNLREWMYPDRKEIRELLSKCIALDCVPVLVARRIPFVTFKVLKTCGVIFHQNYNQLFPESEEALAQKARDKTLLGYHDIRIGNMPDTRLLKFIGTNLNNILPEARSRFDEYKDLIDDYTKDMEYKEFSARVRRRSDGVNEDNDWEEDKEQEDDRYLDEFTE